LAKGNILMQVYPPPLWHSSPLLLCVYLFWRLGKCRRAISSRESRSTRARAGALILLFGLHLLGWLAKLTFRVGIILGILFVILGFLRRCRRSDLWRDPNDSLFSIALIGFFGPAMDNG